MQKQNGLLARNSWHPGMMSLQAIRRAAAEPGQAERENFRNDPSGS